MYGWLDKGILIIFGQTILQEPERQRWSISEILVLWLNITYKWWFGYCDGKVDSKKTPPTCHALQHYCFVKDMKYSTLVSVAAYTKTGMPVHITVNDTTNISFFVPWGMTNLFFLPDLLFRFILNTRALTIRRLGRYFNLVLLTRYFITASIPLYCSQSM